MAKKYYNPDYPRFSRQWWADIGRTMLWVTIITVLIWIFADISKTETETLRVKIRLTTSPTSDLVLLSRGDRQVTFNVQGSRRNLDLLAEKFNNSLIKYDVAKHYAPGMDQAIPVVDILEDIPEITSLGLTVVSGAPATITGVDIDRRIVVAGLAVIVEHSGATLTEMPVVKPSKVAVRVAERRWKSLLESLPPGQLPAILLFAEERDRLCRAVNVDGVRPVVVILRRPIRQKEVVGVEPHSLLIGAAMLLPLFQPQKPPNGLQVEPGVERIDPMGPLLFGVVPRSIRPLVLHAVRHRGQRSIAQLCLASVHLRSSSTAG